MKPAPTNGTSTTTGRACARAAPKSRVALSAVRRPARIRSADRGGEKYDEYVSDPAKPVPYRPRPTLSIEPARVGLGRMAGRRSTSRRLAHRRARVSNRAVEGAGAARGPADREAVCFHQRHGCGLGGQDHRRVAGRGAGPPEARRLSADAVGGYFPRPLSHRLRQAAAARGERAAAYPIPLPHANHTFLPGHRIMVQIQSSWFPLYDRNPQTFVPNIMYAKPESYVKATQRIWRTPERRERDRAAGDSIKHFQWNRGTCRGSSASAHCRTARADSGGEQPVERGDELPDFGG